MKVKDFKDKISKGLGSAILFLKNNPDKAHRYTNSILWACCHDTGYDSQCESGRSFYLYEAICLSNKKEKLENDLLEKLLRVKKYWDTQQLFNIANIMYDNGNIRAREVMYDRFRKYLNRIQQIKVFSFRNGRHTLECAAAGAVTIIAIDKFKGLEFVVDIMGSIMISKNVEDLFDTDWVMSYAQNELGEKDVNDFLQNKAQVNENIKVFFDEYNFHKRNREEYQQNRKIELPNFETILSIADEYCFEVRSRVARRNKLRLIGKKADEKELIKIATELESTIDETKQTALLHVFINKEYPLPIDFLLELAHSSNKELAGAAATALENIKDERIHNLALEVINDEEMSVYALGLLVQNFRNDYDIILDLLKRENERLKIVESKFDFHSLTMGVRKIFELNKSAESIDILLFLYHNTTCSYCRMRIVQIICDNNMLPDDIAEECQYDCVEDTRDTVLQYLKKKQSEFKKSWDKK